MTQYLAFDIGGTNLKYALIDQAGKISVKDRIKTSTEDLDHFLQSMYQVADQFAGQFEGIAVCAPGKIDVKEKVIHFGGALPFLDGLNLQTTLGQRYHVPVGAENDGKAAALSELWLGELKGVNTAVAMTLGTGVGGGIVVDGKVLHGRDFQAGELSWMLINNDKGATSLDAYTGMLCSAVGMIRAINQEVGNSDLTDGKAAFAAIKAGHAAAVKIFETFAKNVAIMILNCQAVLNAEKYVIGGGISAQEIVITEIKRQFSQLLVNNPIVGKQMNEPEIVRAKEGNDANLYGALYALLLELNGEEVR